MLPPLPDLHQNRSVHDTNPAPAETACGSGRTAREVSTGRDPGTKLIFRRFHDFYDWKHTHEATYAWRNKQNIPLCDVGKMLGLEDGERVCL